MSSPNGPRKASLPSRSSSEKDLSFIVLDGESESSASLSSSQSLPDLTNRTAAIPPSYYQNCLADLMQIRSIQDLKPKPNETKSESIPLTQRVTQEVIKLREENIRLLGMAMNNDQSLRLVVNKHKTILDRLASLAQENAELRQRNLALEDKVESAMNEVRLVAADLHELKAARQSRKEENLAAKNNVQLNVETSGRGKLSRDVSVETDQSEQPNERWKEVLDRIAHIESRLPLMNQQSAQLGHRLNDCLARVATEEQTQQDLSNKLNYMNDINQLQQLKLLALESKIVAQSSQQASLQEPPYGPNVSPAMQLDSRDRTPSTVYSDYSPTSGTNSIIGYPSLPPAVSPTEPESNMNSLRNKLTALVTPLKLDRHLSFEKKTSPSNPTSPIQPVQQLPTATNQTVPQLPEDESHSSRRHHGRRHHRIKLFPSRRHH